VVERPDRQGDGPEIFFVFLVNWIVCYVDIKNGRDYLMISPKEIIEKEIAKRLKTEPAKAKAINEIIEISITGDGGGIWTIDCTKDGVTVSEGTTGNAKLTLTMDAKDFVDMYNKKLTPQAAFLGGKVKVKGNIALALKLGSLL